MPRPNAFRGIGSEDALARRIAYERRGRDWSYEGLAKRMTDAGCPIQPSAIYKVEHQPRRRITVNELVALSRVFDCPVDELLEAPEIATDRTTRELVTAWREAFAERLRHIDEADRIYEGPSRALMHHLQHHPEAQETLRDELVPSFGSDSHWPNDLVDMLTTGEF